VDISLIQVDNIDIWGALYGKTTSLEALPTESSTNTIEKLGKNFPVWSETFCSAEVHWFQLKESAVDKNAF
jgi:hypothetical protein